MKTNKTIFIFFNISLIFIFLLSLVNIAIYIHFANIYNRPFLENHSPENLKKILNWSHQYLMSFTLIYLSLVIVWITQFSILMINKNPFLYSLFPLFFLNKIKLNLENKKLQKRNLIALMVILSITSILLIISIIFSLNYDVLSLPIAAILFLIILFVKIPLISVLYFKYSKSFRLQRV